MGEPAVRHVGPDPAAYREGHQQPGPRSLGGAKDVANRQDEVSRKARGGEPPDAVRTAELLDIGVLAPSRFRRHPESIAGEIEHPDAGDAPRRVQGELHAAVTLERGIRDLDQKEDIAGSGVSAGVEIAAGPHDGQVRLRLGYRLHGDGLLLPHQDATAEARAQQLTETSHLSRVPRAGGTHGHDDSVEQLHMLVLREHFRIDHALVFTDAEPPRHELNHRQAHLTVEYSAHGASRRPRGGTPTCVLLSASRFYCHCYTPSIGFAPHVRAGARATKRLMNEVSSASAGESVPPTLAAKN